MKQNKIQLVDTDTITCQEVAELSRGHFVCDMHDGLPPKLDTGFVTKLPVPAELVTELLHGSGIEWVHNKFAYKLASGPNQITLAYLYDGDGYLITIEY